MVYVKLLEPQRLATKNKSFFLDILITFLITLIIIFFLLVIKHAVCW